MYIYWYVYIDIYIYNIYINKYGYMGIWIFIKLYICIHISIYE